MINLVSMVSHKGVNYPINYKGKNMHKVDIVANKEMMEDLDGMLRDEEDYNHTMEMLALTEDEKMIFKRARLHIIRNQENSPVVKKAYQILISKSFHNKGNNANESQNILGQNK